MLVQKTIVAKCRIVSSRLMALHHHGKWRSRVPVRIYAVVRDDAVTHDIPNRKPRGTKFIRQCIPSLQDNEKRTWFSARIIAQKQLK